MKAAPLEGKTVIAIAHRLVTPDSVRLGHYGPPTFTHGLEGQELLLALTGRCGTEPAG